MFQTKSLLKSSSISTGKITVFELKLVSVSITIINLFLLVITITYCIGTAIKEFFFYGMVFQLAYGKLNSTSSI